ncbi:hypothetical protein [Rhodoferax sp.]|uniref:hypothetical protein n=1 Tax=Rhodoferax sp. TaxID=50421 RepID=UPI002731EF10|nr:hypothetical protein [Rhodoferax sp.]MDP1531623.1 hypothetical protein [Rhodoferax sp.]MDP1944180.1 hypothetical protein [Rhodoferax sp.]MDP2441166.1 hypothetical protein [Rhodoferax sp.]MDZ4209492.1 hypothetical protein [Rhodoferax sp.]
MSHAVHTKHPVKGVSLGLLLTAWCLSASAQEFTFDAAEFEKKTFEFSGYLEQKEEWLKLRGESPAFQMAYPGESERSDLLRSTTTLELRGKVNLGDFVLDARALGGYASDPLVSSTRDLAAMEGGLRWSASPGLTFNLGKRVQRWGKGYAWSPVAMVERPKDANDPAASREGFVMASGEWTRSLSGSISAVSITGLLVPTDGDMNADFGPAKDLNPAAKLYLLAWDTDIDLMWRSKGARPESFGLDFSRNLSPALEIHGEWARTRDASRNTVTASGVTSRERVDMDSYLLGLRYLTQGEVTWIAEYYRNGAGYSAQELNDYYQFLEAAIAPGAPATLASSARSVAQSGYARPNPGRDYLYVKASVSEPFDWVYGAASLTSMVNLNDHSYQITPEISYTGFANWELRARLIFLSGKEFTEFGEKLSSGRLEIYGRYFF